MLTFFLVKREERINVKHDILDCWTEPSGSWGILVAYTSKSLGYLVIHLYSKVDIPFPELTPYISYYLKVL